eukprot:scaffold1307_cov106-Skeletonema_dohrnii-CCMP3373.AAC.5
MMTSSLHITHRKTCVSAPSASNSKFAEVIPPAASRADAKNNILIWWSGGDSGAAKLQEGKKFILRAESAKVMVPAKTTPYRPHQPSIGDFWKDNGDGCRYSGGGDGGAVVGYYASSAIRAAPFVHAFLYDLMEWACHHYR